MNDVFVLTLASLLLLGIVFLGIQIRKEYAWLQYIGGFGALFDDDDI